MSTSIPDEIARNYPVALGLMADVRTFLRQVLAELDRRKGVADCGRVAREVAQGDRRLQEGMGGLHRARLHRRLEPDPSAARRLRDRQGAARGRHPGERHRHPSQLADPVLQAEAAGFADRLDGFRPDGFRRRRRARRQARGARPAVRVGGRRRRLLHACERARHRGRIRHPGRLGGVEQLRLCVDPRPAARLSGRARARDRLQASADRRALQSRFRRHGALGRRRGRDHRPRRRSRRRGARRHRDRPALSDRRENFRRQESGRRRRVGAARHRPQPPAFGGRYQSN